MADTKKTTKKTVNKTVKSGNDGANTFTNAQLNKLTSVLKYPLSTEKSLKAAEFENKLLFIVDLSATKKEIKDAIQAMFNVKVKSVNTTVNSKGLKKAYVKFDKSVNATDVATNLGML